VICPAEQTCVIDDAVYDEITAEFERMGAQVLSEEDVRRLSEALLSDDGGIELSALGQSCLNLAAMGGIDVREDAKVLLAPLPSDLPDLAGHPFLQEKLMPVLGLVGRRRWARIAVCRDGMAA
jgi:acetaldehyde dehydrogenase/alcohol dehydrogenase